MQLNRVTERQKPGKVDFGKSVSGGYCWRNDTICSVGDILVGSSGRIVKKRLRPLRRSRSDKLWEERNKQDYDDKCNRLERQIRYHKNLLDIMEDVSACNSIHNALELSLYKDIQEMCQTSMKCLKYLLEGGLNVSEEIQGELDELLNKDDDLRKLIEPINSWKCWQNTVPMDYVLPKQKSRKGIGITCDKSPKKKTKVSNRLTETVHQDTGPSNQPCQVFVHSSLEPATIVVTVNANDSGAALFKAVEERFPSLASYSLLYHDKKIQRDSGILDQGLSGEANIYIHFALRGGMNENDQLTSERKSSKSCSEKVKDPRLWSKSEVSEWVDKICGEFEIEEKDVKNLKLINGAGLRHLKKEDWLRRTSFGDLFFNLWNDLLMVEYESNDSAAAEPLKDSSVATATNTASEVLADEGNKETSTNKEHNSGAATVGIKGENKRSAIRGHFGPVKDFEPLLGLAFAIDDVELKPKDNDVIMVKGISSSRPKNLGNVGTVMIRNDPKKDKHFLELKIDIRSRPGCQILTKYKISDFLNVHLGKPLVVRGRVEYFKRDVNSEKKGFDILPFKIVVDSDDHVAVREQNSVFVRQLSTTWLNDCGIFPAELSTNQPLFKGDELRKEHGILWCADATMETIKQNIVALKNHMTGDILVGVSQSGKLDGLNISRDDIMKKKEDLAKALGGILPNVDSSVAVCESAIDAVKFLEEGKTFVAVMWLPDQHETELQKLPESKDVTVIIRVHVPKGQAKIHFTKPSDTHAFVRVGTDTKMVTDFQQLFLDLESLASRNLPSGSKTDIQSEIDKASAGLKTTDTKYNIFQKIRYESDRQEFKVIYGDPKKIILKDYVAEYTAAFLNSNGGSILFGVDEDPKTKQGRVVGVLLRTEERQDLLKESCKKICNFWPTVKSNQFSVKFTDVKCDAKKHFVKFPKTDVGRRGNCITVVLKKGNIGKAINVIRSEVPGMLTLLQIQSDCFALLHEDASKLNMEQVFSDLQIASAKNKTFELNSISLSELTKKLSDLCVVCIQVQKSPYPIHLTRPLKTYGVNDQNVVYEMTGGEVFKRFETPEADFDVEKFHQSMNRLEVANTSYMMISSPFSFTKDESDLFGFVIPEWFLVLDFDQNPNGTGHLLNIVKPLHDLHQPERNLFMKTPLDRKLDLNPDNGECWCAIRGYQEIAKTLSEGDHANWMMKHGTKIRQHLSDELVSQINPNQLIILCLWNDGYGKLIPSLDYLLQHIFSLWCPTSVVFVCPNKRTKEVLTSELIERLIKSGYDDRVSEDKVFVALPHQLARYLATKMPEPFRSEEAFQIPRKLYLPDGVKTIPETLPQNLRQALKGQLEFMYYETYAVSKQEAIEKAREDFYSGSGIQPEGLVGGIAIERDKMKEVKKELKSMLNDKKSHVCIIVIKAERGAGATTLCLQLLYDNYKQIPCARLLEFHNTLVTNIEKVNNVTNLPLILFVDAELTNLPEFAEFKNEAERRNTKIMFIIVESDVSSISTLQNSTTKKRGLTKFTPMSYAVGTAPYKIVELRRELSVEEVSSLLSQLLKIKEITEETKKKLHDLKERANNENTSRKFALFSLTVFGRKFSGLRPYVAYRLHQADDIQIKILELLALIHVYTDYIFPVNALSRWLDKNPVILESIFNKGDVRELLSPPSKEKNLRRISFLEVAEEMLQQQAKLRKLPYAEYLKNVAVELAENVFAAPQPSKLLDRITRHLYVTSQYGGEKFSPLVRCIAEENKDIACDLLMKLCDVFEEGTSVWAHLMAHLAKYYMEAYSDFDKAIPLIRKAAFEHKEDTLLHHIHGDIIRLHIENLKDKKDIFIDEILMHAINSSTCFETVRKKSPLQEHGYISDALVRKTVMLGAIKSIGKQCFVDYLKSFLEKKHEDCDEALRIEEKFILTLIPDAFECLSAIPISEHTEKLKATLLLNIGDLEELKTFCEELQEVMKDTTNESWIDEAVLKTTTLLYVLEIETKELTPEEADRRIEKLEELSGRSNNEQSMKLWIRFGRFSSKVPNLKTVRQKIESWLKATRRKSPNALFYNYVVGVLEALSDPKDTEKMKRACDCIEDMRHRKFFRWKGVSENSNLPIEWLHPKHQHHIVSIDSLLHHEDLVKDFLKGSKSMTHKKAGKEIIEKALFVKKIAKWDGTVKDVFSDFKGVICLKQHIEVPFVPVNVAPSMPFPGDEVQFCLAFQWNGPTAWYVVSPPGMAKARKADFANFLTVPKLVEDDESSEISDTENDELYPLISEPLHRLDFYSSTDSHSQHHQNDWEQFLEKNKQGIVCYVDEKGFGKIKHPNLKDLLFFHAKQVVPPVENMNAIPVNTVVSFTVGRTGKGLRATNVKVMKDKEDTDPDIMQYINEHDEGNQATAKPPLPEKLRSRETSLMESRQEGSVCKVMRGGPNCYGFIQIPGFKEEVHFSERVSGIGKSDIINIREGVKVQFQVVRGKDGIGYSARNLYIQRESDVSSCSCGWEGFAGKEVIQEGYVGSLKTTRGFGFIYKEYPPTVSKGLYFNGTEVKNFGFTRMWLGQKVHFKVERGYKSCLATDINVQTITPSYQPPNPYNQEFRSTLQHMIPRSFNRPLLSSPESASGWMPQGDPNVTDEFQLVQYSNRRKNKR